MTRSSAHFSELHCGGLPVPGLPEAAECETALPSQTRRPDYSHGTLLAQSADQLGAQPAAGRVMMVTLTEDGAVTSLTNVTYYYYDIVSH